MALSFLLIHDHLSANIAWHGAETNKSFVCSAMLLVYKVS